jgi:hypothetical protein
VVKQILKGRERRPNEYYQALSSHYTFAARFCMPARGNEKPHAETLVRIVQRQWATPVPKVKDFDELNANLKRCAEAQLQQTVQGYEESIGQRFEQDRAKAMALPEHRFDACVNQSVQVDKFQRVHFDCNRYSVPREYAFCAVTVKGYVDRIEVVSDGVVIARHQRSYERHKDICDPLHYLGALERKPGALDHAPVMRDWQLPDSFKQLRERLEKRYGQEAGTRQYSAVLSLMQQHPLKRVQQAVEEYPIQEQVSAERIAALVRRLAVQETSGPTQMHHPMTEVDVPRPDLGQFDRLLEEDQ